jgi:hypothetical protein
MENDEENIKPPNGLKIVEMRKNTLREIPSMLRKIADDIDKGEYDPEIGILILHDDGETNIFEWGDVKGRMYTMGLLSRALQLVGES